MASWGNLTHQLNIRRSQNSPQNRQIQAKSVVTIVEHHFLKMWKKFGGQNFSGNFTIITLVAQIFTAMVIQWANTTFACGPSACNLPPPNEHYCEGGLGALPQKIFEITDALRWILVHFQTIPALVNPPPPVWEHHCEEGSGPPPESFWYLRCSSGEFWRIFQHL